MDLPDEARQVEIASIGQGRRPFATGLVFGRPCRVLAIGGSLVALLAVALAVDPGGFDLGWRCLFVIAVAATSVVALEFAAHDRPDGPLRYHVLAGAVAHSGVGIVVLQFQSAANLAPTFLIANVFFVAGSLASFRVVMPALYRRLDRRHWLTTALDGYVISAALTTLILTLWRTGETEAGPDQLIAPIVAAAMVGSVGAALTAALARRWPLVPGGIWVAMPAVVIVGSCWILFVDLDVHGRTAGPLIDLLYAAGMLLVTYGWVTWTEDVIVNPAYDRFARAVSDWLPLVAIVVCVAATALPHSRMNGADVTWAGTSLVVVLTLIRQKMLISSERAATARLVGEERLRADKEAAEASAKAKGDFLAMISHEIRTPMNAILGNAELLSEGRPNEDQVESIEAIAVAGQTLMSVIDDVLDFSKIEAGRMRLERVAFDVAGLVHSVAALFAIGARAKDLSLSVEVDPEIPEFLTGDPHRLRQILFNLVGNAIKFTTRGGITIRACLGETTPEWTSLRFEVVDTGIGIGHEERDLLFAPFVQADASTTRRFGGTGLGLAICRGLVTTMGGEIGLQSEKGVGSTFWFTLRLDAPSELEAMTVRVVDEGPTLRIDAAGARVLVADDNAANRRLVERLLDRLGVHPVPADDGQAAIREIESGGIDLVLMDVHMPEMDGLEVTRLVRSRGNDIPIVAVTADATAQDRAECLAAGMNDYLSKPIHQAELVAVLRHWLPSGTLTDAPKSEALAHVPGAGPPTDGILDEAQIEELLRLDPDGAAGFMASMVGCYVETQTETLPRIRAALDAADCGALDEAAHKLKGVAANVGVRHVYEATARLVVLARSGDLADGPAALGELEAAIGPAEAALAELVSAAADRPAA